MWVSTMLRACVRGGVQEKNKVHFVLDEAASLGHMEALDDAVDKYRGFGVRCHFIYQDLGQLKKSWPDGADQTLLANTSQIYFGVNDLATAEHVRRVGRGDDRCRKRRHESRNIVAIVSQRADTSLSRSRNSNDNWQQQAHKLLTPAEVMALPPRVAITFTPGCPPIWTKLLRYYEERNLPRTGSRNVFTAVKTVACSLMAALYGAVHCYSFQWELEDLSMSKATRAFFEGLKDMVGDGLNNIIPDLKAELGRLGTHGAVELGQALFNGQAFTPYGPVRTQRRARKWA